MLSYFYINTKYGINKCVHTMFVLIANRNNYHLETSPIYIYKFGKRAALLSPKENTRNFLEHGYIPTQFGWLFYSLV